MTDIDEAMLIAWVDGELDEVTRRRVDRAVADGEFGHLGEDRASEGPQPCHGAVRRHAGDSREPRPTRRVSGRR